MKKEKKNMDLKKYIFVIGVVIVGIVFGAPVVDNDNRINIRDVDKRCGTWGRLCT